MNEENKQPLEEEEQAPEARKKKRTPKQRRKRKREAPLPGSRWSRWNWLPSSWSP